MGRATKTTSKSHLGRAARLKVFSKIGVFVPHSVLLTTYHKLLWVHCSLEEQVRPKWIDKNLQLIRAVENTSHLELLNSIFVYNFRFNVEYVRPRDIVRMIVAVREADYSSLRTQELVELYAKRRNRPELAEATFGSFKAEERSRDSRKAIKGSVMTPAKNLEKIGFLERRIGKWGAKDIDVTEGIRLTPLGIVFMKLLQETAIKQTVDDETL